ncbi:MAG: 50S ribosomal protein L10, partial [Planctomycetota bacterium]
MSRPVKEMMMRDYKARLGDFEDALVVSLRGIDSNRTNEIRDGLAKKQIRVTVIRNRLFLKEFEGTGLAALAPILNGSNAVAYGAESVVEVAREIVELAKANEEMELKSIPSRTAPFS